jgi:NADP-dependent 3-hydroxy acid dehydrogenase YdfG
LAAAAALAEVGAHFTLLARTAAEITEAARAIEQSGGHADTLALDVTDLPAVRASIEKADPFDTVSPASRPTARAGYRDNAREDPGSA